MEEKTPKRKLRLWLKIVITLILVGITTLLYARFIATSGLITKEYLITNKNLPDSFYGLKVAHVSDIHYGQTTDQKDLKQIVARINETKPDIIVITGDLLDRDILYTDKDLAIIEEELSKLQATMGKYIIMGNHDHTQEAYLEVVSHSGLTNLDDSYEILYNGDNNPILIAGMSTGEEGNGVIMHEPDYVDDFDSSYFQLILAGHSHNGQVRLPFIGAIILPPHAQKYYDNYYNLGNTDFYISSGVGTSTIRFRFFNKPSFNLYRIVNH